MLKQQLSDLPKIIFSLLIIGALIFISYLVLEPFLIGFAWAVLVVVSTWKLFLLFEKTLWKKRWLAILCLLSLILIICIFPLCVIINNIIHTTPALFEWLKNPDHWILPALNWLNSIPIIGDKLHQHWQFIISNKNFNILETVKPYIGQSASWFLLQVVSLGHFAINAILMLIFSAILYSKGEIFAKLFTQFITKLAPVRGEDALNLAVQSIRAIALGIVVTAFIQSFLGGIAISILGIKYSALFTIIMFIFCLAQIGPSLILLPCCAWLYWVQDKPVAAIVLLIISLFIIFLDNFLRPMLIKKGVDLHVILILTGVIGGLLAFGMLGLFIGPVVLAVSFRLIEMWSRPIDEQ